MSSQVDATPFEPATPWRRYWARFIDIAVSMFLVAVVTGAIRPSLIAQLNAAVGARWVLLLLLPVGLTMDTLLYRALGNTPGKAIAGIKVLAADGRRLLSAPAHLRRNFGVYLFGLGLGLPLVSLFTLIYGYRRAAAGEVSTWDRFCGSRVYALSDNTLRTWLAAGLHLAAIAGALALGLHSQQKEATYAAAAHAPAPILQQELIQAANGVNAAAPKMIDRITRLDGARVGPGSLFTYDYTLTSMSLRELSPTTLAALRWRLSAHVRQAVCSGNALKPMLRTGTTVRFNYRDRDGQGLVLVSVSSADCGI